MREIKRRKIEIIPFSNKDAIEKYTGFSLNTLRNWRANKKNLELFIKIGGRVYLDKREWDRFVINAKKQSKREAKIISKIK